MDLTSSREVRVEVQSFWNSSTCRRFIGVSSQQREDVVTATVAALDDERQIWRKSTLVGSTSSLLVGVRVRDVVGKLSDTLHDVADIVGLVVVLALLGHSLGLINGVCNSHQCTPWDTGERVA